ncbi:MAG: hypothetical protein KAJ52_03870, partial [Sedimentisphaerales bacterium]|nr:hypothetical protein [Sedimentisphaerales bacterium]
MSEDIKNSTEFPSEPANWSGWSRQIKIILAHMLFFTVSLFLSFIVESNMEVEDWFPGRYLKWLLLILAVKLIVFGLFHQYKGWWRYASVSDLLSIIKASHLSTVIIVVGWYVSNYIPTT